MVRLLSISPVWSVRVGSHISQAMESAIVTSGAVMLFSAQENGPQVTGTGSPTGSGIWLAPSCTGVTMKVAPAATTWD